MKISALDISALVQGTVEGDTTVLVDRPSGIEAAQSGTITFVSSAKYADHLYTTQASIVLIDRDLKLKEKIKPTLIRVENVQASLQVLVDQFKPKTKKNNIISEKSEVASTAILGENVAVGIFSIVGEETTIGQQTLVMDQVYIGDRVTLGEHCLIYPGVRILADCVIGDRVIIHANAVVGDDGFGFLPNEEGVYQKITHLGNVIIEDDVEIGNNTTIDKGTYGSTIVRKGVKLDNHVQIAHNADVGDHTVMASHSGVAGSSKVGKHCVIGGQVGIVGHIQVADGTHVQGQTGVTKSITQKNTKVYGTPSMGYWDYLRSYSIFRKLPKIMEEINKLKEQISKL